MVYYIHLGATGKEKYTFSVSVTVKEDNPVKCHHQNRSQDIITWLSRNAYLKVKPTWAKILEAKLYLSHSVLG